jgi:hypothetical protein
MAKVNRDKVASFVEKFVTGDKVGAKKEIKNIVAEHVENRIVEAVNSKNQKG